jgi:hypothetical protein
METSLIFVRVSSSQRVPGIPSSMIKRLTFLHRCRTVLLFFLIFIIIVSNFSLPRPMPAKECNVVPPMFTPAIPVEAVTASEDEGTPKCSIILRRSTDFPVPVGNQIQSWVCRLSQANAPADPVKKTFSPLNTLSNTICCV